jgi:hypothetical protein
MVHRNILAARSPVFATLLAQLEGGIKEKTTEKLENIQVSLAGNEEGDRQTRSTPAGKDRLMQRKIPKISWSASDAKKKMTKNGPSW